MTVPETHLLPLYHVCFAGEAVDLSFYRQGRVPSYCVSSTGKRMTVPDTHLLPLLISYLQEKLSTCPSIDKGGYYVSSTGKRLVHGDVCNSGLSALIPDTDGKGSLNPGELPLCLCSFVPRFQTAHPASVCSTYMRTSGFSTCFAVKQHVISDQT